MRYFFFLSVCLSIIAEALGQQSTTEGALRDAEFVIKKERKLQLPATPRLFKSAPNLPSITDPVKPLEYTPPELWPTLDMLSFKTKILRAKQDIVTKRYSSSLRGGCGNFCMPILEGFFASKHHTRYTYSLQVGYLSAGKENYAEEVHNLVQLRGQLFTEYLRLGSEVAYHEDKYPLYNPAHSAVVAPASQTLRQFTVRSTLANYVDRPLNYQVDIVFRYLCDAYQTHERQWECNGEGDYPLNDALRLKIFSDLYLTQHGDATAAHRNLWRCKPMLFFLHNSFDVKGGINLVYQDDACYASHALSVYPILAAKYFFCKWLQLYIDIGGDMQCNTLQSFLQENPLLASQAILRHTNQRIIFCGGARGNITEQISGHAGLSVSNYQNFHCLINSDQDPSRFDVEYDSAATLRNVFCELSYTNRAETFSVRLRGDAIHYILHELSRPWHRPRYKLDCLGTYHVNDKLIFKCTMCWIKGVEAWDVARKVPVALQDVFDAGLEVDYWLSARLSAFLNCQNLLARKNERYLNYPSRGFHCMAGISYMW